MKTSLKALIILGLTWVVFLVATFPSAVRDSLISYVILSLTFFIMANVLLYYFIFKRSNKLQQIQSEIKKVNVERKLTSVVQQDILSGLPNRAFFNTILNKAINQATRHKKIIAILIINLDAFKEINVRFGKNTGDLILKKLGNEFSNTLRTEDVIAKLEGDEFIVLLNDIQKPKFASAVAEKLLTSCSEPFEVSNKQIKVTASIGICIFPNDGHSLEELLNNANVALDNAKHSGKNIYKFYSKELEAEAHEYVEFGNALKQAVKNNEFVLYFQPKMHLKRGSVSGVETFLRWQHPQYGLVTPDKFLSIAEDTGLIVQIGEWILQEACRINKYWQDEGYEHMTIAVNLSTKQFYHPDIATMIAKAIDKSGLDPSYLEIEITESTAMNDIEKTTQILEKIKNTGVKMTIDHFGTGYISISHLKNIAIQAVKIDKNFIKGLPLIPNDIDITNAFIALAHSLNLEVIAEGVETIEQAQHLADQQCDVIQGYFLSHPVPASKITLQFKKLMDTIL